MSEPRILWLEHSLGMVIRGKSEALRLVATALFAGGHVLLEDVPGTGKTTLAKALARSIDGRFRRIQFTPDVMPNDITGSSFYVPSDGSFQFREGPVFTNVLLADEINRTSPRTQSALLEALSERQVTVEGEARDLPSPFFVIATQNPSEYHGTYPLPEAQLDRFAVRLELGYPSHDDELGILYDQNDGHPLDKIVPVLTITDVLEIQTLVRNVRVEHAVAEYILHLIALIRGDARLRLGLSPRASLMLYRMAQARSLFAGRDYALVEDVRELAVPVLAHRLQLNPKAKNDGTFAATIVADALKAVPVPR